MNTKKRCFAARTWKTILLFLLIVVLIFVAGSGDMKKWVDTWFYTRLFDEYVE